MCERPVTPRTVRPRKVTGETRVTDNPTPPLVVVSGETVFTERDDQARSVSELPAVVASHPPAIFVCQDSGHVLKSLDETFTLHPEWQFRITPIDREIWKPNREGQATTIRSVVINWFGFKSPDEGKHRANRYHSMIDPHVFLHRFTLDDIAPMRHDNETDLMRLYRWGAALRDWATRHGLKVHPSAGGLAAQLLRDPRFYPEARRKVPRSTNARARDVLPGNHYDLRVREDEPQFFSATYIDQVSAHHSAAASIALPQADRLYAKGRFHKLEGKPWATKGTRLFDRAIGEHGLFYLSLKNPHFNADRFILPCQRRKGWVNAFVWSNELPFLRETGTEVLAIIAAWTSDEVDTGIPAYSKWALTQLQENPQEAGWMKPTLLSAYGILAARPKRFETAYRHSAKGERAIYVMGGEMVEVRRYRAENTHETNISNVIQRGMIEAETRLKSIRMAAFLQSHGLRVLAVYADSVFIENTGQGVPLIPNGWTVKGHLDKLQFFNSTSFHSDQLTKLPGIPKDDLDRLRRIRSARAFFAELQKIEKGGRRTRRRTSGRSVRPHR